jgi:hypothetical protein
MYPIMRAVLIFLPALGPSLAGADDPDAGADESSVALSTEDSAHEQAAVFGGLNPYGLPAEGFIGPTFEGPWRFRVALNGWVPTTIKVTLNDGQESDTVTKSTRWLLDDLKYVIPVNGEVRKGSFGFFVHTFFFKVKSTRNLRHARIKWNDHGFWIDTGLSYELGRWALGDGPRAPELTLEPFVAARLIRQDIDVDFTRVGVDATSEEFSTYEPIIGLRTFWDLTEHWNLHFEGDYGGFGVDDNHETWHALGLVGYRWPARGVHWNLQAGYRAIQIFDLRPGGYKAKETVRGPNIMFGFDF